jgi:predicted signal transduction protein with EAL and GGDEF domain
VDTVARLAGDEFVILMEDLTHPDQVAPVARRIVDSMQEPMDMLGHAPVITVSIGSAIYPHDDLRIGALLTKADAAMYEAKAAGRNGFRSYSPEMPTGSVSCISLESELRKAIERDELELHFQPQLALDGQQVCGVEALLRWQHPERGMVPPLEFIPVAEESGLIVGLGRVGREAGSRAIAQLAGRRPASAAHVGEYIGLAVPSARLCGLSGKPAGRASSPGRLCGARADGKCPDAQRGRGAVHLERHQGAWRQVGD